MTLFKWLSELQLGDQVGSRLESPGHCKVGPYNLYSNGVMGPPINGLING